MSATATPPPPRLGKRAVSTATPVAPVLKQMYLDFGQKVFDSVQCKVSQI